MRNLLTIFTLSAATLLVSASGTAQDAPAEAPGTFAEPSIVNPTWAFDLKVSTPNAIAVPGPNGRLRWYWYIAYKVTNNTGEDRLFIPEVVVLNNHGEIIQANRRIPPAAYPAIADRLGNTLLESPNDVVGRLLQGPDFAKESVAIWPASFKDVDEFTVFFGGVDGETKMLRSPTTGEPIMEAATDPITGEAVLDTDGNVVMRPIMVQRTRALTYQTPGTPGLGANLREQPVQLIAEYEVMR
ncbi:MAG: hypothetical protein AAF333_17025 [Planctomycetota bacterium]